MLLLSVSIAALAIGGCGKNSETASNVSGVEAAASESTEEAGIAFPYEADDGKLIVDSIFSSDISNPDCNNEYADGVASIEFENKSGDYLQSVNFQVTMTDGTQKTFTATDIPADAKVWAFETGNQTVDLQQSVAGITCDTSYGAYDNALGDQIQYSIDGTIINIVNASDQELSNIQLLCHSDEGDAYYGGTTYRYTIDTLAPGESTQIDAAECLMGVSVAAVIQAS